MSKNCFGKYSGAGNSFLLVDDRFPVFDIRSVPHLCRQENVDGLILLGCDTQADFRMRIFNCDGSEAESCGNGLRCLIRFLEDLSLPRKLYRIATADRIVEGEFLGDQVRIGLGEPRDLKLNMQIDGQTLHLVNTGVPHAVFFVSDVEAVAIDQIAPPFRHRFNANINFAAIQKDGSIRVRTYERGLERETLACGTGAAAVGMLAILLYDHPSLVRIVYPGGELQVDWKEQRLYLSGSVSR